MDLYLTFCRLEFAANSHGHLFGEHYGSYMPDFLIPEIRGQKPAKEAFESLSGIWYGGSYHPLALIHRAFAQEYTGQQGKPEH